MAGEDLISRQQTISRPSPAQAAPGGFLPAGRVGADGQRTLKFCLLALAGLGRAGALLHYNYTAWTSFIMAGLHWATLTPGCPLSLSVRIHNTLSPPDTDTRQPQAGSGNTESVGKNGKILHRRERETGGGVTLYYD